MNMYQRSSASILISENSVGMLCGQLRPTLCDPMDCSLPGSSIHRISQARILGWGCRFLLQGIFLTPGWNPCLLHWQVDSLHLSDLIGGIKRERRNLCKRHPWLVSSVGQKQSYSWDQQIGLIPQWPFTFVHIQGLKLPPQTSAKQPLDKSCHCS